MLQRVPERRAVEQLHHQIRVRAADAEIVDRDDVRVCEAGGRARLALEPLRRARIADEILGDELHRDSSLERRIERRVNGAHAALPEALLQPIAAGQHVRRGDRHQPRAFARARRRARAIAHAAFGAFLERRSGRRCK